jgi:predicted acylesterase/phospholipase RssA
VCDILGWAAVFYVAETRSLAPALSLRRSKKQMKRLLFSGGGSRCILFAQALVHLEKANLLHDVREYWGTSAGAFLAMMLAIGLSPTKIHPMILKTQFQKFRDMDVRNLFSFQTTWGLDDGASLIAELERVVSLLAPKDILLKDIPGLHIVLTDVTARETLVMSGITHPHIRAVDAVRASMSLPLFYRPYRDPHSGHWWNDGALRANFAWDLLPSDEEREQTLGLCFLQPDKEIASFLQYMFSMVHFDEQRKQATWLREWSHRILCFPPPPFPAWYSKIDGDDIAMLEETAATRTSEWLTAHTVAGGTGETRRLCGPPNTRPSSSHPAPEAESSGIPKSSASPLPECPSPQSSRPRPSYRRWSV